jgi:hypothetical protein
MLKTLISSALALSTLLTASALAVASPSLPTASGCYRHEAESRLSNQAPMARFILVRDARASMGGGGSGSNGGGGNTNSCWSACFSTYNNCIDNGPKEKGYCVSRMKTCLAICDTSAN